MDTVSAVQVSTNSYFVVETHKNIKKRKNTDADTMYGNNSLKVTQKACFPHYLLLKKLKTGTMPRVNHMKYQRAVGKFCVIRL